MSDLCGCKDCGPGEICLACVVCAQKPKADSRVHEYGVECKQCGGSGFQTDAEREQMPGCPMSLDYELPLGTEGLKLARKHEIAERRTAGTSVKTSREVAGLTQGELARKAGVSRSTVSMGEKRGTWGPEALAKIEAALSAELASFVVEKSETTVDQREP